MTVTLESAALRVVIDPNFGAEITSLIATGSGVELLVRTPWGLTAQSQRQPGLTFPASASEGGWMARYAGGWQILFPHAGHPEEVEGLERTYHGEASVAQWHVVHQTSRESVLETALFTVPATVTRAIALDGTRLSIVDTVTNTSAEPFTYDYVHHPAFGAPFLHEGCVVETGARVYVADPRAFLGEFEPGARIDWPAARLPDDGSKALNLVPAADARIMRFGWLEDFAEGWAAVRNPRLDLGVRLSWDARDFPFAWYWLEAGAIRGAPWFGRGHTLAIEPATTPAAGPNRSRIAIAGGQTRKFSVGLELLLGSRPIGPPFPEQKFVQ